MRSTQGRFITFEGIDGSGKTTQVHKLAQYLAQKQIPCIVTREPGGSPIAEKIRELILSPRHSEMSDICEVMLYCAARAQHCEETIRPALADGTWVLCDRFIDATYAYQGFGRGLSMAMLRQLNEYATVSCMPHTTFLFDIDPQRAFERLNASGKTKDRMEKNSVEFFHRVREGYRSLAGANPQRIHLIHAEATIDAIFTVLCEIVAPFIAERTPVG